MTISTLTAPTTTTDAADREAYALWVAGQLDRVAAYGAEGNGINVWNHDALRRAGKLGTVTDADAYRGPYRVVRPYLSAEMRDWFEHQGQPRWTIQAWRDAMRAEREAERVAASDPSNLLESLAYAAELMRRRGDMIAELREANVPWARIVEASGLSRSQCNALAAAARMPF
jgi:hypothetical protein